MIALFYLEKATFLQFTGGKGFHVPDQGHA